MKRPELRVIPSHRTRVMKLSGLFIFIVLTSYGAYRCSVAGRTTHLTVPALPATSLRLQKDHPSVEDPQPQTKSPP